MTGTDDALANDGFTIRTLGEFSVSYAGRALPVPPTKKARALLAFLVMHRTADVSREALLERFWPDFEPERARDNLKVSLWSIRRSIRAAHIDPDRALRADRTVVRWIAPVDLDAERFEKLCALSGADAVPANALDVYRGDFLEGDFDDWSSAQRERFAGFYESMLSLAASRTKDVAASQALVGRNPYDEAAYITLIEAELKAGRPQAAGSLAERCRAALAEVGAVPSESFEARFGSLRKPDGTGRGFRLPFVARDTELGEMTRRLHQTKAGGGSVTLVHGDAGIGKSSVLHEARETAHRLDVRVVDLRCRGRETQTLGEWSALYEAVTGRSFAETVKAAGARPGVAIARELAIAIESGCTALFVDDAQNVSGESFGLLVELAKRIADRACVIITSRPEGVARLRTELHGANAYAEIRLDCLSGADLESALRQGSGSDVPELSRAVFERTKGHPLYVVETLAALVENGTLARTDQRWTVRGEMDDLLPVSATMRAFIEGRLNARGSVPASIASALALEPAASASELGNVLGMDETTLLDALDDLLSLGLIEPGEADAPFSFSHDLVQEAAAAMLNAGRRVRIHAAFARELEKSDDRNAAVRRARHLLAAAVPLDASGEFLRAARAARKTGGARDALDLAREGIAALERLEASPERDARGGRLYHEAASAALALSAFDDVDAAVERSAAIARSGGRADDLADTLLLRARAAAIARPSFERVAFAHDALDTARTTGDLRRISLALVEVAAAERENGERGAALRAAGEAFELASAAERFDTAQSAGAELMLTHATWWNFAEALLWVTRAGEAATRAGSAAQAAHRTASAVVWFLLDRRGEAERELHFARRVIAGARPYDTDTVDVTTLAFVDALNLFLTAECLCARRDGDGVLRILDEFVDPSSAHAPARADVLAMLRIEGLLLRGAPKDLEEARRLCDGLSAPAFAQHAFGLSACRDLTVARVLARCRDSQAASALRGALDVIEDHAHRTPLAADDAFARLESAAREHGSEAIAIRAADRAAYFKSERRAAAGSGWGGGAV